MAALLNDRNQLLFASSSRVTGASVSISAGATTALIVLAGGQFAGTMSPSSIRLSVNTTGYAQPSFSWSYALAENGFIDDYTNQNNLDPLIALPNASMSPRFMTTSLDLSPGGSTEDVISNPLSINFVNIGQYDPVLQDWWRNSSVSHVVFKVVVTEQASGLGINQAQATLAIPIIREGINGASAINSAALTIYKRTPVNTPPELDTLGTSVYTFNTGVVAGIPAGWSQVVPQAVFGTYIWASQTVVSSPATSVQFENTNWTPPVLYSANGVNGRTNATIYAYIWSTTVPTTRPTNVSYNFATNQSNGLDLYQVNTPNIWSVRPPTVGLYSSEPGGIYLSVNTVVAQDDLNVIVYADPNTWSPPVKLSTDGVDGVDGTTILNLVLYSRNTSISTPPAFVRAPGYYNRIGGIVYGELMASNPAWKQDPSDLLIPDTPGAGVLWAVQTSSSFRESASGDGMGGIGIPAFTWSVPYRVSTDGVEGTRGSRSLFDNSTAYSSTYNGANVATTAEAYAIKATELIAYYVGNAIPTTPIDGDTVTFTNNTDYVYTITYNSDTDRWEPPGTVIDGNLLVTGSVTASKIDTRGLTIRDLNGNPIFGVGVPITEGQLAPNLIENIKGRTDLGYTISDVWDLGAPPYYDAQYNTYYGGAELVNLSGAGDDQFPNLLGPRKIPEKVAYVKSVAGDGLNNEGWAKGLMQRTISGTQSYRFILPVFKYSGGTTGTVDWGLVYTSSGVETVANFVSVPANVLDLGKWYFLIGYLGNITVGYMYDTYTGQVVNLPSPQPNDPDYPGQIPMQLVIDTLLGHRAQYVSGNGEFFFAAPIIHLANGTEPNLEQVLSSQVTADLVFNAQLSAANAANDAATASSVANIANATANQALTQASSAVTVANAAASGKLSKTGSDILSATISIDAATGAGFRASPLGDVLQWNASGVRTSGRGVAMTPGGIIGHNGAKTTFAVSAATGNAVFSGDLQVVGSGQGLARTEITNNVIKVYDSSGVLRVKIGDLNA